MNAARKLNVVVTRPALQSGYLTDLLRSAGFNVISALSIELGDRQLSDADEACLGQLSAGGYSWGIFTSANAAKFLAKRAGTSCVSEQTKIAAIGPSTARAIAEFLARQADHVSSQQRAEMLASELSQFGIRGQKLLFVAGEKHRLAIPQMLSAAGAKVDVVSVYKNFPVALAKEVCEQLALSDQLVFTFFSPSAFESVRSSLVERSIGDLLAHSKIVSVGAVTSEAIRSAGYVVSAESDEQSEVGVLKAISTLTLGQRDSR